jgi:hypothetical protein
LNSRIHRESENSNSEFRIIGLDGNFGAGIGLFVSAPAIRPADDVRTQCALLSPGKETASTPGFESGLKCPWFEEQITTQTSAQLHQTERSDLW